MDFVIVGRRLIVSYFICNVLF